MTPGDWMLAVVCVLAIAAGGWQVMRGVRAFRRYEDATIRNPRRFKDDHDDAA